MLPARNCRPVTGGKCSGFEAAHLVGQDPQGAVKFEVLVNALHLTGAGALAGRGAGWETSAHEVFLQTVKGSPQIRGGVSHAARAKNLGLGDGGGGRFGVVSEGQRSMGKGRLFTRVERMRTSFCVSPNTMPLLHTNR